MKKFPIDYQDGKSDCGVCCLRMILKWYGGEVSKEYLKDLSKISKEGTSAYNLIEAGKILGLAGKGVKGDFREIKKENLPCIAHTIIERSYQHFVVIYQIDYKRRKVIIGDPAKGLRRFSFDEFQKISTEQFLFFQAKKKLECWKEESFVSGIFKRLIKEEKQVVSYIIFFSCLTIGLSFFLSYQWKLIYDVMILPMSKRNQELIVFILLLLPLCSNFFYTIRNHLLNYWLHRLEEKLLRKVFTHLTSLSYLYYKNRTTGEIISRINDLGAIATWLGEGVLIGSIELCTSIVLFTILCFISWKISLIFLAFILIQIVLILALSKRKERKIRTVKEKTSFLQSFLTESIEGMVTVKNLHIEEEIKDSFTINYSKFREKSYRYQVLIQNESFIKKLTQDWGANIILLIGSIFIIENKLSIGTLLLYQSLEHYVWNFSNQVGEMMNLWKEAKISLKRINDILSIPTSREKKKGLSEIKLEGEIYFNNLSYKYNNQNTILHGINLNISKGEKILLYGKSGSGKSTLAKIIALKLSPKRGQLSFDGNDSHDINTEIINRDISYISQDEYLFTESIHKNIVAFRDIDYEKFLEISKLCLVEEIANKNILAYDTLLEENGFNISGGERQRILLARGFLKESQIYILDETFSQMDVERERDILMNLFKKFNDQVIIVISHRFYNQDLFDRHIKMEKGKLYETKLNSSGI